jgi:3-hydroxyisobutyrate dehydrogenase-like beta-hydroxyacid dehydrogenase
MAHYRGTGELPAAPAPAEPVRAKLRRVVAAEIAGISIVHRKRRVIYKKESFLNSIKPESLPIVAFLGIGLMGKPMAARLLQAGYRVHAWNRTARRSEPLQALGAELAATPAAAVQHAAVVLTMLEDGAAVSEVIDQALPALQAGTLLIDMSSIRQSQAQEFAARLQSHSVAFLDAPVSGGVGGAEAGTLAIMVGGNRTDFLRAEPLLGCLGRATLVGPAGCGQLAKLCNQLIVGGTLNIVAEALLLAQAGGADPAAVRAAIRGGFAESRILEVHGQRMLERNFLPGGKVKLQLKDLDNVLDAAVAAGVQLPVAELVSARYRSIVDVLPNADHAAALLALELINPGVRLGDAADQLP